MKRALIIHGDIYGFGGAENFAVKLIRTIQDCGVNVTVLHAGGDLDVTRIYDRVGIELDPTRVRFIQAFPFHIMLGFMGKSLLLRYAFVLRRARRLVQDFDFAIGTYGEVPIDSHNIVQAVHIPLFFFDHQSLSYLGVRESSLMLRIIRIGYVIASRIIAGWSRKMVSKHLMIANSKWTAALFQKHYPDASIETIYHGVKTEIVAGHPYYLSHRQRENTAVIIGRVVPFKRVHLAIEIVDRLRTRGHQDLRLLIIGDGDGSYAEEIEVMQVNRPYVQWRRNMPRMEMEQLISRQRWGLHAAEYEHYGLAPLELQSLGCVTFVHDSGGQVEAVKDLDLKYCDVDDAVEKMDRVMRDKYRSQILFDKLPGIVADHTTEVFKRQFILRMRDLGYVDT